MLDLIKSVVNYAYDNIPLYRKLYQKKPIINSLEDFKNLPYLRISDLCANSIADSISDIDEIISTLPPIENKSVFSLPRLESIYDRDVRYSIFYYLLNQTDIEKGSTFAVITDAKHAYYCGEIVNNLLFYKYQTSMFFLRDHTPYEMYQWIDRIKPDCLFLGTDRIIDNVIEWGIPYIFTINRYDKDLSDEKISHYDIYSISEVCWIGIRVRDNYLCPKDFFYIESDPIDGILVLTTIDNYLQPFIRYKTGDRAKIIDENKFKITYIGEH
ncbi:MAG: hypothetical protein ACPL7B_00905 [Candidatus Poribacteria bacterium]